ncbi:MAG: carboxypeptidase regulatory-like domain-containing protein [Planctomycetales bacterium]|nr:carboxypeptidase regulatory-like domain-containing protein [Planctomycetales bacterium]
MNVLSGCGSAGADYSKVDLIQVSGTVTLDGQPLPNAVVTFETPDGQFSYGMTDSSGHYELQFDSVKKGVTSGPKIVRISTARKILGLNAGEGEEGGEASSESGESSPAATELVPEKYNKQSELKVEVSSGNAKHDFILSTT